METPSPEMPALVDWGLAQGSDCSPWRSPPWRSPVIRPVADLRYRASGHSLPFGTVSRFMLTCRAAIEKSLERAVEVLLDEVNAKLRAGESVSNVIVVE